MKSTLHAIYRPNTHAYICHNLHLHFINKIWCIFVNRPLWHFTASHPRPSWNARINRIRYLLLTNQDNTIVHPLNPFKLASWLWGGIKTILQTSQKRLQFHTVPTSKNTTQTEYCRAALWCAQSTVSGFKIKKKSLMIIQDKILT